MGIFGALFGKSKPVSVTSSPALVKKTGEILEHAMQMISVGSFKHLVDRYQPIYGEDAQYLAAQVLMLAILQEPANDVGKEYKATHQDLIMSEAKKLHFDPKMEMMIGYLYAAHILHLSLSAISVGKKIVEIRATELTNRATELSILAPDPHDFSGKEDAYSWAVALAKYGDQFVEQEKTRPSISILNSFDFGKFKLDEKLDDLTGLVEFSPEKYALMIRRFKGEKNYEASPINFFGRPWQLMLSTVHGQICKIAVNISLSNELEATPIATEALQFCKERLGSPTEQKTGLFVWDTKDGNVVLQTTEGAEGFLIAIYLTSSAIPKFELL